jgi:hypothetical protein
MNLETVLSIPSVLNQQLVIRCEQLSMEAVSCFINSHPVLLKLFPRVLGGAVSAPLDSAGFSLFSRFSHSRFSEGNGSVNMFPWLWIHMQ